MYKTIAIIEKSKIIREGLAFLFKSHNIGKQIAKLESLDHWTLALKPDLIIINPEFLKEIDLEKVKTKFDIGSKIPLIGLIYQYFDRETYIAFNNLIYITDSEETILNKVKVKEIKEQNSGEKLTDREKDVLKLLLKGMSNKEVADKLIISPHTVITHRKNIIEKTGIRSLSGLAVYAILNNITNMDEISELDFQ